MIHTKEFQKFLDLGREIVAEHKAQYQGIYYMKGGFLGEVLDNPITNIASDIFLTATGNPEFIPLVNAAETTGGNLISGQSLGKSLGQGAISGIEALAGQEAAGAVGIGEGNTAFNNALGITGDNPAGTGLPDIGGLFGGDTIPAGPETPGSAAIDSTTGLPVGQESVNTAGATINTATGDTVAAPQNSTAITPSSGGGFTPASSANDFSSNQISANLGGDISGTSTAESPGLGSLVGSGSSANSAIGATSTDSIGSIQPSTINLNSGGAAPAAAGAATPATGGLLNTLESGAAKAALPLGALAYESIKGPAALPSSSSALEQGGAATAPLLGLENQGATEAQTGQLTSAQQATITQQVQHAQNLLLQQLASQGVTDPTHDSRYIAGMQDIQQQAAAQQQQYITAAINEATSAGGAASNNLSSVANEQIQNDKDYQDALAAAFGALGSSLGGININTKQAA